MALTDEGSGNGFFMPVAPAYGGGNNGFGGFGGDGWAWIILLLLIGGGGWGFNGFGGGYGAMMGMDGFGLYPWLNNSQNINDGFRDQMLNTNVANISDKITTGFGDVQNALCGGFAGVNANINNATYGVTNALHANQITELQAHNALQAQLAQCCCDNRAGLADVRYTIATENCADRAALSDGIRDLLAATQAQTQTILDKMCADKIDQKNDTISQLRQELLYARGQASQVAQNSTIINGIYDRLNQCPVGTVPVFDEQPIFTCPTNVGNNNCGCGCANNF